MRARDALLLGLIALIACHRDEPMVDGRPLSHWAKEANQSSWMPFWNSTSDGRRAVAFRRLSEIGEPAVPAMLDLMQQGSVSVSGDAFNALANLGPRARPAVPQLIEMLGDEDRPQLQERAIWLLGTIGSDAAVAVPPLTVLLGDADTRISHQAAVSLGQIGGSGRTALERARASGDVRMRRAATHGLAASGLPGTRRGADVATALRDPSPAVRAEAMQMLSRARPREDTTVAALLVRALDDSSAAVKHAARQVLTGYLQRNGATSQLLAAVLRSTDTDSRTRAAWHMQFLHDGPPIAGPRHYSPDAVDALVAALEDPDPTVRVYAASTLVRATGAPRDRAARVLRRSMTEAEPIIAVRGARALWVAEGRLDEVRSIYERGLQDTASWNRVETLSAILELGPEARVFIPRIEGLLTDPASEVRHRAERTLEVLRRR